MVVAYTVDDRNLAWPHICTVYMYYTVIITMLSVCKSIK